MKTEKVSFVFRGRKFSFEGRKCGFFSLGLIGRTKKTKPCIFKFARPSSFRISALFVFFPFVAVWLDGKNNVVDVRKVEPFTFSASSRKSYHTLVEIPLNKKYFEDAKFLIDGKG